jgi:hypothetical protein
MSALIHCQYCEYETHDCDSIRKHTVKHHSRHPQFCITCSICGGKWQKYSAYVKHVQRKHQNFAAPESDFIDEMDVDGALHADNDAEVHVASEDAVANAESELQRFGGTFLLRLQTRHSVGQTAIDDFVVGMQHIVDLACGVVKHKLAQLPEDTNLLEVYRAL